MDSTLLDTAAGNAPAPAPADPLASNPFIAPVLDAKIPGWVADKGDFAALPDLKALVSGVPAILKLGLAGYGAKSGEQVLFNPRVLHPEEIKAADAAGKLRDLLPDVRTLAGGGNTPPAAAAGSPGAAPVASPAPASPYVPPTSKAIAGARANNIQQRTPPGAVPGAGTFLSDLARKVV